MDELFPSVPAPQGARQLGPRFALLAEGDIRVLFSSGQPIVSFHIADVAARDLTITQLCLHSGLSEHQIAAAFDVSRPTVSRAKKKYTDGGVPALVPQKRGPRGPSKIKDAKAKAMVRMAREGYSKVEIGKHLGVNESSVRKALRRLGCDELAVKQPTLPFGETTTAPATPPEVIVESPTPVVSGEPEPGAVQTAPEATSTPPQQAEPTTPKPLEDEGDIDQASAEAMVVEQQDDTGIADPVKQELDSKDDPVPKKPDDIDLPVGWTSDVDPDNRFVDRFFAQMGLLDDAAPMFADREKVSRVGLLLAIPILATHHVFKASAAGFT
jgi:transposase